MEIRRKVNEMKILYNCFKVWYNIVLERRLQMGKVRVFFDWKLFLRIWNAWRFVVRFKRFELEVKQYEIDIIKIYRNN